MSQTTRPQTSAVAALLDELDHLVGRLLRDGDVLWSRTADWVKPIMPTKGERGGGTTEPSDDALEDRLGDRAASRYHEEVRALMAKIRDDAARLTRITQIVVPSQPRQIAGKDMLAAQVAASGLCVSCWRYDMTNKEREQDQHGHYFDKEACRRCVAFKREHGIYPPLSLLEVWHARGKNWTVPMVTEALDAARQKRKAS